MVAMTNATLADIVQSELAKYAQTVEVNLRLGITGTRNGPAIQSATLCQTIGRLARGYTGTIEIHHGCCTGIDETAHDAGSDNPRIELHGHPGIDARGRSPYRMRNMEAAKFHTLYPERIYAERNLSIVIMSTLLIACPLFPEDDPRSLRSGTWQTIRYARKHRKPVIYIMPNGVMIP